MHNESFFHTHLDAKPELIALSLTPHCSCCSLIHRFTCMRCQSWSRARLLHTARVARSFMIFFVLQTQLDAMPELIAHSLTQIRPPETRASLEGGSTGGSIGRLAGGRGGGGGGGGGRGRGGKQVGVVWSIWWGNWVRWGGIEGRLSRWGRRWKFWGGEEG